jgi:hypothetical protein
LEKKIILFWIIYPSLPGMKPHTVQVGLDMFPLSAIHSNLVQHACFLLPNSHVATKCTVWVNNSMKQHYWCDGFSLTLPPYISCHTYIKLEAQWTELVSSTYANILKYYIQGMPTNIILQVFLYINFYKSLIILFSSY